MKQSPHQPPPHPTPPPPITPPHPASLPPYAAAAAAAASSAGGGGSAAAAAAAAAAASGCGAVSSARRWLPHLFLSFLHVHTHSTRPHQSSHHGAPNPVPGHPYRTLCCLAGSYPQPLPLSPRRPRQRLPPPPPLPPVAAPPVLLPVSKPSSSPPAHASTVSGLAMICCVLHAPQMPCWQLASNPPIGAR